MVLPWISPNTAEIAAKVIDGEAIMINLSNGTYYSMLGVGGLVWELLADGNSVDALVSEIVERYHVVTDVARADLDRLLQQLIDEHLVFQSSEEREIPAVAKWSGEKLHYEPPQLEIYSDMGDLLALDPPMPGLDDIPWAGTAEPARSGH